MKNYLLISIIALSVSACNQAEIANANHEKDSLAEIILQRDSSLNDVLASFNDVELNLDSISVKQHIISLNNQKAGELKLSSKERINAEIAGINSLMNENRKKISDLNRKLKNSGNKNAEFVKTIAILNSQLAQMDQKSTELNAQLQSANAQVAVLQTSVENLTVQNTADVQTIAETTASLHKAYYIVGKTKDLEKAKLIDRNGGLLGIGKTTNLRSDFDNSLFTKINYTELNTIPVNGKNIKIITSHSSDSYSLDKDANDKNMVKNIVITDAEKFWSTSKYLVVVKD